MCGIVGCFPKQKYISADEFKNFDQLMHESKIRGMHAYGIAYKVNGIWKTYKSFTLDLIFDAIAGENLECLVGHTRYDTSGDWRTLENNQPVVVGNDFLVFNGVIRMTTKEEREKEFEEEYTIDNDGEILLNMLKRNNWESASALLQEKEVSYAGIQVANGLVTYYRNERRPLWRYDDGECLWIASTKDILERTFVSKPNKVLNFQLVPDGVFHVVK